MMRNKLVSMAAVALAVTAFAACSDDEEDPAEDDTELPTDTMMVDDSTMTS